jgi:hypothetical protein
MKSVSRIKDLESREVFIAFCVLAAGQITNPLKFTKFFADKQNWDGVPSRARHVRGTIFLSRKTRKFQ